MGVSKRFEELDSLRGLAALTVLCAHFMILRPYFFHPYGVPATFLEKVLVFTPAHIFWAGREAVIFFFVLSGFVLSLQFYRSQCSQYGTYLIKRVFRIYPAYWATVFLALFLSELCERPMLFQGLSAWAYVWQWRPFEWRVLLGHLFLVGNFTANVYDPVIWTLRDEMQISIFFPVLLFLWMRLDRLHWSAALFAALIWSWLSHRLSSNENDAILYVPMFMVGALLARYHKRLVVLLSSRGRFLLLSAAGIGALLYCFRYYNMSLHPLRSRLILNDWAMTAGCSIFIMIALTSVLAGRCLRWRPLLFMGKISYSFYLLHVVVLLSVLHVGYGRAPLFVLLTIVFLLSLLAASLFYYFLEIPGIRLGKYFVDKFSGFLAAGKGAHA